MDLQYSPEAVMIIVTFTKDNCQSTTAQKGKAHASACHSLTKSINALKLSYIQSISWLLKNRHNSNAEEKQSSSSRPRALEIKL